jgi:molybdopterin/thiamine biosynthesis adenylyltransferase/rhodanese-related sulfurtransferase
MPPLDDLLNAARNEVPEIEPDELRQRLQANGLTLIDVREDDEWKQGHLPHALHVSRGMLEMRIEQAAPDKRAETILYCAGGNRSLLAGRTLKALGYSSVKSLAGGINAWARSGFAIKKDRELTTEQLDRYSRHIMLPQVGKPGQAKLLDAKVLVVGAGGLGSPVALYLAAAGVGTLGIIDNDVVDRSNLQRQVLHDTPRVGHPKAESAKETLQRLNPDVNVVAYTDRLTADNVESLVDEYDIIVDGSDNFETRYLLNDAAYFAGKPNVHGSIFQFDGQMTVFHPKQGGPCYRCIFPEIPEAGACLNCAEAGVLGVLPGAVGLVQATETLKLLLGIGETLIGRLLVYDALRMRFREFNIARDPECLLCGDAPSITTLKR